MIPVESQEPITLLSLQGTNMEALAEWVAFTNTYDQDLSVAHEADMAAKAGSPWDIPENYQLTYGCYSQEMVDKLNEIVEKYDLKLLSSYIPLNYYENSVLLNSLGLNGLVYANPNVQVEYWDGDFHLEGTFDLNMYISMDMGDWKWERGSASFRYSLKDYFDSLTGCMLESIDYTQWDYTRKDGEKVLLVLSEGTARIYANLPDAFISISLDPVIWVDGEKVPMTQTALEQFAELFDLSVKPQPTTMEQVEKQKADAQAQYEAERAAARAEHEAMYAAGYKEFVEYRLETVPNPENVSYVLYDVNGDGVEELIIGGLDILSMKDGQSYKYFDLTNTGVIFPHFQPCEGNVFEVYCEDLGMYQHYFYQANAESASFITGVSYDAPDDAWYLHSKDGAYTENRQQITEEEAQNILDSYTRVEFRWLPLKRFGEPPVSMDYSDPYAQYIAEALVRYDNAKNFAYALMDLNGDSIEELITRQPGSGQDTASLRIFTIQDGDLKQYASDISYICTGGILEKCEEEQADQGRYYGFYRCGANGPEFIEKIVRDPYTLYWGRGQAGKDGRTVTEEEAMSVLNSYKRIELDMKPFPEYPLT
ncbi:hypothetical protein MR626_13615 [bacterium]|nr:hypothetical protein [bacterium]